MLQIFYIILINLKLILMIVIFNNLKARSIKTKKLFLYELNLINF